MKCSSCGSELRPDASFCAQCGNRVFSEPQNPVAAPPPPPGYQAQPQGYPPPGYPVPRHYLGFKSGQVWFSIANILVSAALMFLGFVWFAPSGSTIGMILVAFCSSGMICGIIALVIAISVSRRDTQARVKRVGVARTVNTIGMIVQLVSFAFIFFTF